MSCGYACQVTIPVWCKIKHAFNAHFATYTLLQTLRAVLVKCNILTLSTIKFSQPIPPKPPWYAMTTSVLEPLFPTILSRHSFLYLIESPTDKSTDNTATNNNDEPDETTMMLIASLDKISSLFYSRATVSDFALLTS